MMMSSPCCDWPVLLSVNPTPDRFDYLKQRKRWTGDSNLATMSVFTLFLSFSPGVCLMFIVESCDSSSLPFSLSLYRSLHFCRYYAQGEKKGKGTYLNCQSMIVGMSNRVERMRESRLGIKEQMTGVRRMRENCSCANYENIFREMRGVNGVPTQEGAGQQENAAAAYRVRRE